MTLINAFMNDPQPADFLKKRQKGHFFSKNGESGDF